MRWYMGLSQNEVKMYGCFWKKVINYNACCLWSWTLSWGYLFSSSHLDIAYEFEPERNVPCKVYLFHRFIKNNKVHTAIFLLGTATLLHLFSWHMQWQFHLLFQRHDITKRRIDAHGNIIETRADTIGAPKVNCL